MICQLSNRPYMNESALFIQIAEGKLNPAHATLGGIMGIVTNRAASRRLSQNWGHCFARGICVLLTAVILVLLCSSCRFLGLGSNAAAPEPAMSPAPARSTSNPNAPEPPMSPAPPGGANNPSGTVYVPQGKVARVFAEPYLDSAVVGTLNGGTVVEILCTAQGDKVSSGVSGGTSSLWDKTQYGYIPDVNVDTGTTQPAAGSCS